MISILSNLNEFTILENFPHLYSFLPNGKEILKSNVDFINNHVSNFSYSEKSTKKKIIKNYKNNQKKIRYKVQVTYRR